MNNSRFKFRAWDADIPGWIDSHRMGTLVDVAIAFPKSVTLMQNTGLHDKNGKEIYEGDIVGLWGKFDEGWGMYSQSPVEFKNGAFSIMDYTEYHELQPLCVIEDSGVKFEVIGNVFENLCATHY